MSPTFRGLDLYLRAVSKRPFIKVCETPLGVLNISQAGVIDTLSPSTSATPTRYTTFSTRNTRHSDATCVGAAGGGGSQSSARQKSQIAHAPLNCVRAKSVCTLQLRELVGPNRTRRRQAAHQRESARIGGARGELARPLGSYHTGRPAEGRPCVCCRGWAPSAAQRTVANVKISRSSS